MNDRQVRVRFAPSPTGPLHIGGVRTALYNYLLAKKHRGNFIIRIEDTDQNRYVPGAEEYIFESLQWLGIEPDESPSKGGPHAPYRQSERKEQYISYAKQLVDSGNAYYAFDSTEELEHARKSSERAGAQFQYNFASRLNLKNSLTLEKDETDDMIRKGIPYVIRLKIPVNEEIRLKDEIRGWVVINSSAVDDKVLIKSDGMPTYHLANVVDDHIMGITHVIRGEEWLPSAPAHVLLYKYLGWMETMPVFAHLPLLLKPEGSGKLSKRDADKGGFPIFPINWKDPVSGELSKGFREYGYLPEATINFLALLGWNPGTEQELFTIEDLIKIFSLDRVNKSGAKFDIEKAKFFNQQYLRKKPVEELAGIADQGLRDFGLDPDPAVLKEVVEEMRERVTFPEELYNKTLYFFRKPEQVDLKPFLKNYNESVKKAFGIIAGELNKITGRPDAGKFREIISNEMIGQGIKPGHIMQLLRVIITGSTTGIDLMKTLELLGPPEVAQRIEEGIRRLP